MIRARVLGPVEVTLDDGAMPPEILWRKNLALLVYLACSPRGRTREHLLGLLWPDKPESSARHSLNEALRVLRKAVGEGGVTTPPDQVRLATGAVQLDTDEFEALVARGDWERAAALVAGEFLEGFAVPGASPFEDWLTAERRSWGQRTVDALLHCADEELDRGRTRAAAETSRRALAIDPLSESAGRTLMRALTLEDDRSTALREFDALASRLASELGATPGAETAALAERIRRERGARPRPRPEPDGVPAPRRAPLVGRGAELDRLWSAWQRARAARTSMIAMLAGDPGVGKSRLADELAARMRLEGACTTLVRAVESDRRIPWAGLIGWARGGLLEAAGVAAAPPGALAWFASRISEWGDRFAAVRGATPLPSPVSAFSEVLRAALGEQPVALIVDDAEWLDRDSLLALSAAVRDLAHHPLAVLLTMPAQAVRQELDELQARVGRDVDGLVVRLTALSGGDIRELARWAVPRYTDAERDRLARRVTTDSAGLPLLAVELLNAVALGLDLEKVQGAWPEPLRTLDQTLPGALPPAVVGAIRVGYRRLTPSAQRVLQAAAVLGLRVGPEDLTRATGLTPESVAEALDELEWSRWLTAESRGYTFVARIVRQVVDQDLLTAGQRRRLLEAVLTRP